MSQTQASQEAMRREWEELNKKTEGTTVETEATELEIPDNPPPVDNSSIDDNEESTDTSVAQPAPITQPIKSSQDNTRVDNSRVDSPNFRRLRENNKELERRLAETEAYIRQMQAKKEDIQEIAEDYDLKDDDIMEGKHGKALKKEVKSVNKALEQSKQQLERLTAELRLRSDYPDIFKVVNKENMEKLSEIEPELVESLLSSSNTVAQHVAAYKLIKKYNIGTEDPYLADKARAQKNMAKPKSAAMVSPRQGESPLSEADRFANGLTDDVKAQLLKEMDEAISNRN